MIKRDEIENQSSCLNKARDGERLFVMLARDPAAPVAIRAWIAERLRLGKNTASDEQIREAFECASLMELERSEIRATSQESLRWTDNQPRFAISRLTSVQASPTQEIIAWDDFAKMLVAVERTPCTRDTCVGHRCAHKVGACWSPATFLDGRRSRDYVEDVHALVFQFNDATLAQIGETRARLHAFTHLIHATHADRDGKRCARVVVALSKPVAAEMWPAFWRAAQQLFAPDADPTCFDAGRLYFMPTRPKDADYLVEVNAGIPYDVERILNTLPRGARGSIEGTAAL